MINWDQVVTIFLTALPPTGIAYLAYKQALATHMSVNSRMDELLKLAKAEATAQATLDEKNAELIRKGEAATVIAAASKKAVE